MAITDAAQQNHDELFPGHVSTLKVSDPELIECAVPYDRSAFGERMSGGLGLSLITCCGPRYGHGKGPYQPTVESIVFAVDQILKPVALTVKSSIAAASKMVSSSPDRARCH